MHDARPALATDAGQRRATVKQERVDQRAALMRCRRVHDHPRGFVDDDEMRVFVDDGERQVFGQILDGNRRRRPKHDELAEPDLARRPHDLPADRDLALVDATANLRARHRQLLRRQPDVEPLAHAISDGKPIFVGQSVDRNYIVVGIFF